MTAEITQKERGILVIKTFKGLLALLLVICLMLSLFAACAKTEQPAPDTAKPAANETEKPAQKPEQKPEQKPSEEKPAEQPAEEQPAEQQPVEEELPFDPDEPTEVVFWMLDINNARGADHQERLERLMNEITEPYGIHVKLSYLQIGDYISKVQMSIAGNEQIDLLNCSIMNSVPTMHRSNMLQDITDLLDEYAPETVDLMRDYLVADTYDGRIFGVPVLRGYVTNNYLVFQKDLLAEAGLVEQAEKITSWSELEEVLAGLYDHFNGTGVYAFVPGLGVTIGGSTVMMMGDSFADIEVSDNLGDPTGTVYCDPEGKVHFYQATDAYRWTCEKAKEWMDKGWSYPDAIYNSELSATEVISQGVGVVEWCAAEHGVDSVKRSTYGADAMSVMTNGATIKTSTLTAWGIGVPVSAQEPEAAVYLLNLIYTNEDLMHVLVNGEEGVDYDLVDGQSKVKEGAYNLGNYVVGNNLLAIPVYGNGADFYDVIEKMNNEAPISKFLGFNLDTSAQDLVISQLSAVSDQYRCSMNCGGYTEDYLQEYLDMLNAAGVQDYLDAVQAQADAWLAAN